MQQDKYTFEEVHRARPEFAEGHTRVTYRIRREDVQDALLFSIYVSDELMNSPDKDANLQRIMVSEFERKLSQRS